MSSKFSGACKKEHVKFWFCLFTYCIELVGRVKFDEHDRPGLSISKRKSMF